MTRLSVRPGSVYYSIIIGFRPLPPRSPAFFNHNDTANCPTGDAARTSTTPTPPAPARPAPRRRAVVRAPILFNILRPKMSVGRPAPTQSRVMHAPPRPTAGMLTGVG